MAGIDDIAAERQRQINVEGWTAEHDDEHANGCMASAAACYALAAYLGNDWKPTRHWPWDEKCWKPKDRRRNLVIAGALIAAEIDRIDRAAKPCTWPACSLNLSDHSFCRPECLAADHR
jgi:hypothetical protein